MSPDKQAKKPELVLAVDRLEGPTAVLVDEDGRQIVVPVDRLPRNPKVQEGDVLRVPVDHAQRPDWFAAVVDQAETERRRAEARVALEKLKERDPGGDVQL
jgi:hypothetical protein